MALAKLSSLEAPRVLESSEQEKKGAYQAVKWQEKENWIAKLSHKKNKNVALEGRSCGDACFARWIIEQSTPDTLTRLRLRSRCIAEMPELGLINSCTQKKFGNKFSSNFSISPQRRPLNSSFFKHDPNRTKNNLLAFIGNLSVSGYCLPRTLIIGEFISAWKNPKFVVNLSSSRREKETFWRNEFLLWLFVAEKKMAIQLANWICRELLCNEGVLLGTSCNPSPERHLGCDSSSNENYWEYHFNKRMEIANYFDL